MVQVTFGEVFEDVIDKEPTEEDWLKGAKQARKDNPAVRLGRG